MEPRVPVIGMIGGVSWESTAIYYQLINQQVRALRGGLNSAKILLYSLNYAPIVALEIEGKWDQVGIELADAARTLEEAGVDFIVLCCNTLHKVAPQIEQSLQIPFIHIADPAGCALQGAQLSKIALLGTQFTMEEGFYAERLSNKFGLEVIVPNTHERRWLDDVIYNQLCQGQVSSESKQRLIALIEYLCEQGAQAVLLACTELGMLVAEGDVDVPVYDTALLHAQEAALRSLTHVIEQ